MLHYADSMNLYRLTLVVNNTDPMGTQAGGCSQEVIDIGGELISGYEKGKAFTDFLQAIIDEFLGKKKSPLALWLKALGADSSALEGEVLNYIKGLNEFRPTEPCGKWYKNTLIRIFEAAQDCSSTPCTIINRKVGELGTASDLAAECYHAQSDKAGGATSTSFYNFANQLSKKCAEMVRERSKPGGPCDPNQPDKNGEKDCNKCPPPKPGPISIPIF